MPSLLFWRQYLRRPLGIGAIAPSSSHLARAMVEALRPTSDEVVVELGPGTGVFTRQLLKSGVAPDRLVLIEFDRQFAEHLRNACPGITVIEGDARRLPALLASCGHARVPKVLSGLPLRSMALSIREEIGKAIWDTLAPGGTLVQFTYFNAPPLPEARFAVERVGKVIANIPPAHIWRYSKRHDQGAST
jgi:phosphatidylethanolamine/phosphatidyl-N-methylethanolamine N-methyltransferase